MPYRTPARWLAPLSLAASVVAVILIVTGGSGEEPRASQAPRSGDSRPVGQATSAPAADRSTTRRGSSRSSYTVRSGDVLSAIAQRTGVSVERLQALNPDIDAQALRVGQRLKLRE